MDVDIQCDRKKIKNTVEPCARVMALAPDGCSCNVLCDGRIKTWVHRIDSFLLSCLVDFVASTPLMLALGDFFERPRFPGETQTVVWVKRLQETMLRLRHQHM